MPCIRSAGLSHLVYSSTSAVAVLMASWEQQDCLMLPMSVCIAAQAQLNIDAVQELQRNQPRVQHNAVICASMLMCEPRTALGGCESIRLF